MKELLNLQNENNPEVKRIILNSLIHKYVGLSDVNLETINSFWDIIHQSPFQAVRNNDINFKHLKSYTNLIIQLEFDKSHFSKIQHQFDQVEEYAKVIDLNQCARLIDSIDAEVINNPTLLHNLTDILTETQAHGGNLELLKDKILTKLKQLEPFTTNLSPLTKVQVFELLSPIGLFFEDDEYYIKYINQFKNINLHNSPDPYEYTMWGDNYFRNINNARIQLGENLINPNYGLNQIIMVNLKSFIEDKPQELIIDEYNMSDDILYLQKQNLKNNFMLKKKIFLIHGHDEAKWRELQRLLESSFHVKTIVLQDEMVEGSPTIIEKLETTAEKCDYAIAIFTPDDQVENKGKTYLQARPNVIFELGWFFAKKGRNRTLLILKEGTSIFSDLGGIERLVFKENIEELFLKLKEKLKASSIT